MWILQMNLLHLEYLKLDLSSCINAELECAHFKLTHFFVLQEFITKNKVLVTGTPLQNSVEELWYGNPTLYQCIWSVHV